MDSHNNIDIGAILTVKILATNSESGKTTSQSENNGPKLHYRNVFTIFYTSSMPRIKVDTLKVDCVCVS